MGKLQPYQFKTDPYAHQLRGFELTAEQPWHAYTMEQRTGKTKLTFDVAAYQYEILRNINLLFIVAPNGVHRNWLNEELPIHLPDRVPVRTLYWGQRNHGWSKKKQAFSGPFTDVLNGINDFDGLSVLSVNVEAVATEPAKQVLRKLLKNRRAMLAVDESSIVKTPDAPRTKTLYAMSTHCVVKRIMDGTPDAESPLELYSQYAMLSKKIFGFSNYYSFRSRYAEMEVREAYDPKTKGTRQYKAVKAYQRIDELNAKRAPYTFRVLRADCFDMPPKVYSKRMYTPSTLQIEVYEKLREEFRAEVRSGLEISGANVLARYVRYQQVLSNFVPGTAFVLCPSCLGSGCEACRDNGVIENPEPPRVLDESNHPRLAALETELRANAPLPTIVWGCFTYEVDEIMRLARDLGRCPCRYDGQVSDDEKERAKIGFQAGDFDLLVGKASSGGRGITLSRAQFMVYYNNYFALRLRLQSEDRAEGAKKTVSTGVCDVVAAPWSKDPTIDELKVTALRSKQSLSAMINGDPARSWI